MFPDTLSGSVCFAGFAPPASDLCVSVIVPARDEASHVTATLEALRGQQDAPPFEVLLLCNNCLDDTAEVARQWASRHAECPLHIAEAQLSPEDANIGTVRRALMDAACARLEQVRPDGTGLIASTDADTRPEPDWLRAMWCETQRGADAVGSRIFATVSSSDEQRGAMRNVYLRDTGYRMAVARLESLLDPDAYDPWPRHFQFFGAGLGVTCRAYREAGGLPPVPNLEDMAFESALKRRDFVVRHSPQARVWTSARREGRVETGFSSQLQEWLDLSGTGGAWRVPPAHEWETLFRVRRALRDAWQERALVVDEVHMWSQRNNLPCWAEELGITAETLQESLGNAPYFGGAWETLIKARDGEGCWQARFIPIPVEEALNELRAILRRFSGLLQNV